MGKRSKSGAGSKAKKRIGETYEELKEAQIERSEQVRTEAQADETLFVLDTARKETAASNRAKHLRAKKEESKKRKLEASDRIKNKVKRIIDTHGQEGAIALAEKGRKRLDQKRIRKHITATAGNPTFDLWSDPPAATSKRQTVRICGKKAASGTAPVEIIPAEESVPPASRPNDDLYNLPAQPAPKLSNKQLKARRNAELAAPNKLAVEVAHPGQSYHPDKEHHQDAIGEALSIEIRRNEALDYKQKPISDGMSQFTKEFIINNSDEDDSSDDEDDTATNVSTKIIKRKEKLTRAQRNKQKRVKAEETALKERRERKKFMHQVHEVKKTSKEVRRAEEEQRQRNEELAKLKHEKKARPLGKNVWEKISQDSPIDAPTLPVALTGEIRSGKEGGGLRTLAPKGSLVTDRLESMVARNMIAKKKTEVRKRVQGKRRKNRTGVKGTEFLLV